MSVTVGKTTNNKPVISIDRDEYKAQLFPIASSGSAKGSELAFNCSLFLKKNSVNLSFPVRTITSGEKAGNFLAGAHSRLGSHRAVVTQYIKPEEGETAPDGTPAKGKEIELASIPFGIYADLMAQVKEGDTLLKAQAAQA